MEDRHSTTAGHDSQERGWFSKPRSRWDESDLAQVISDLRVWHLWDSFDEQQLLDIAEHLTHVRLAKGKVLFSQGTERRTLYLIHSGILNMYSNPRDLPDMRASAGHLPSLNAGRGTEQRQGADSPAAPHAVLLPPPCRRAVAGGEGGKGTDAHSPQLGVLRCSLGRGHWCGALGSLAKTAEAATARCESDSGVFLLAMAGERFRHYCNQRDRQAALDCGFLQACADW